MIKEYLEHSRLNLRERANLYLGMTLPPLVWTSTMYFGALNGRPYEDSLGITLAKISASLLLNIPVVVPEIVLGSVLGATSAIELRNERVSKLERT